LKKKKQKQELHRVEHPQKGHGCFCSPRPREPRERLLRTGKPGLVASTVNQTGKNWVGMGWWAPEGRQLEAFGDDMSDAAAAAAGPPIIASQMNTASLEGTGAAAAALEAEAGVAAKAAGLFVQSRARKLPPSSAASESAVATSIRQPAAATPAAGVLEPTEQSTKAPGSAALLISWQGCKTPARW
jgi:hypothetical protein